MQMYSRCDCKDEYLVVMAQQLQGFVSSSRQTDLSLTDTTSLGSTRGEAFRVPGLRESIVWILRFSEILCWNNHIASVSELRER